MGKSGPIATFNLCFLGLGWPWVGDEFVGFVIICTRVLRVRIYIMCFPTQYNLMYRVDPSVDVMSSILRMEFLFPGRHELSRAPISIAWAGTVKTRVDEGRGTEPSSR